MSFLNSAPLLTLQNSVYLKALKQHVWQVYLADLGAGDVTTEFFVNDKRRMVRAEIIACDAGIWAGAQEAKWFLKELGIDILKCRKEGQPFRRGDVLLVIKGRADRILAAERTLLNLVQRMSGIATATSRLASKLPRTIKLLATRKTFWGLLDKRAVVVGGGGTHRLNLDDAVLIKDNHLLLNPEFETPWKKLICKAKKFQFIEMELDNLDDVKTFALVCAPLRAQIRSVRNVWVMLDNLAPLEVRKALRLLRPTGVQIEASGGITVENIKAYVIKGVNAMSSGSITNKAPAINLSLRILS